MTKKPKTEKMPKQPKPAPVKKQTEIPGTERKCVAAVEDAANALRAVRLERMELQKAEAEQVTELIDVMRKHDVKLYKFEGEEDELVVELVDVTKVKVRKANTARSEDE